MQVHTYLLSIWNRGIEKIWPVQGGLDDAEAFPVVPPLGEKWL